MKASSCFGVIRKGIIVLAIPFWIVGGCEVVEPPEETKQGTPMANIEVPEDFEFSLRACRSVLVQVQTADGSPYKSVKVDVRNLDGGHMATGFTGPDGRTKISFVLPAGENEVIVFAPAIGIINSERRIQLLDDSQTLTIR